VIAPLSLSEVNQTTADGSRGRFLVEAYAGTRKAPVLEERAAAAKLARHNHEDHSQLHYCLPPHRVGGAAGAGGIAEEW
jgi:hypothetical protein